MRTLKTENCIVCGKQAKFWYGYVLAKEKRALGYVPVKVIAGFCDEHKDTESDESGFYGNYNPEIHGKCKDLFIRNTK